MVTEYLDTPDRAIAARKWTLRRRTENGEAVYTIKTPGDGYARGEWESRKESLHEAVRELVRLGAPGNCGAAARGVSRTCGVEFLRRTAELTLDGARCALCLDDGMLARRGAAAAVLRGGAGAVSGEAAPMLAFAAYLQEHHALREERKSKFVRASELVD